MKNVIIALTGLLFSLPAMAVGPAPSYLQGGVITVTLKDGKTYTFSSDEYAVVKRGEETPLQVTKLEEDEQKLVLPEVVRVERKNIVSVGVVNGTSQNLRVSSSSSHVEVKTERQTGVQAQYQRLINDRGAYLGVQADTNENVGVSLGVGF